MNIEIWPEKACPCCEGQPALVMPTDERMLDKGCYVQCLQCGLRTGGEYPNGDSAVVAVAVWDTRPEQ